MGPSVNEIQRATSSAAANQSVNGGYGRSMGPYDSVNTYGGVVDRSHQSSVGRPLRERTRSRSRSPTDRILDIQTEDNLYTEVFSWGADHQGQLGLGINLTGD